MKHIDRSFIVTVTLVSVIIGCATHTKIPDNINSENLLHKGAIVYAPKQDTPRTKGGRIMTPQQIAQFIAQQYQDNYNKFFAPEFQRQNQTISNQSKSIKFLTDNLKLRQHKSDSIVRDKNLWMKAYLRSADSTVYWQKIAIKATQESFKATQQLLAGQKLAAKQNETQISKLNSVVNYILIGGILILLVIVAMAIAVAILWRRITMLYKNVTHA